MEMARSKSKRPRNVLFLCTGNSARSILAESLLNHWGEGRFCAYSAGSHPTGNVHPLTLRLLVQKKLPATGARSKSWDEFAAPANIEFDFVIAVCDKAAGEVCPIWPGKPVTAHWRIENPATATGSETERTQAFHSAYRALEQRVRSFVKHHS